MSQQLQITGGAKVRDLNDVIIGTSGVLSSLAFNVANGVPKLDSNAKILVSQLPNSVMEYKGTWDASTNTPTLVNGTGNQGDVYLCNVAGTVNFGAGPIAFFVGDQVIYSGTIWQRASGATGTVTSVAVTESGDSLNITGSPITTSGTINIGFNGTNLQYINGAGDLTTFPTLISSIGLSMPSAFSVANSPLTSNGTIAVTGAGYPSQYIRGDGTLADFPTSGGGGSSVSYYLNGGTSQGTIGGVTYYEMSKTADTGTMADFSLTGNGFIVAFLTDAGDPAQLNIPAGNWNYEIYASMSANGGTPEMYAELYKYDGTTFTLIATSPHEILYDGTALNLYTFAMTVPSTTLAITDRLAVKLYATNSGGKTTTVHTQDSHLCQIITTFSTGITALNGLTAQVQYFATGTSGTDFNISSTTATHTFNIPDASASARGLITTGTQTIGGAKTYNNTAIFESSGGTGLKYGASISKGFTPFTFSNLAVSIYSDATTNNVIFRDNLSSAKLLFDNSTQTYTFPAASGTIAILEAGSQTFTGTVFVLGSLGTKYGISIEKGNTPSPLTFNDIFIYASSGATSIINFANSSYITSFSFPTSNQTFTYPAATGTIALTSDLGGYVPYTGATASVNIGAFSLLSSGFLLNQSGSASLVSGYTTIRPQTGSGIYGFIIDNGNTGINQQLLFNNAASYIYTFPSATGTLALGTGTTNYISKFTGTNTIGNSLIFDNGTNVGIGNTNTSYTLDVSGTLRNTTSAYFATASGNVLIGTSTAPSAIGVNDLLVLGKSGSASNAINFSNGSTTNWAYILAESAKLVLGTGSSSSIAFETNAGSERMRITSGGNVLIGTTTDAGHKLQVNGTTQSSNYTTINNTATIPALGTATILTLSSSVQGVYIVQANFGAQGNTAYGSTLIIVANSGTFRIVTNGSGASAVLTLSGANVQLTNAIGSPLDAYANAILISY